MLDYPNTWIFGRWALHKVQHMKWRWSYMWNIGRISCYICQDRYLVKMPLFWRVSSLQIIGDLTTPRFHCWPLLLALIQKTQFDILIVGQKTWGLQLYTPCLEILMMGILFSWACMIMYLFLFGWEKHKVMLWRVNIMNFSKWWRFNGGFLW